MLVLARLKNWMTAASVLLGLSLAAPAANAVLAGMEPVPGGGTVGNPSIVDEWAYAYVDMNNDEGESFTIEWLLTAEELGGGDAVDLSASATFTLISLDPNEIIMDVVITNTTLADLGANTPAVTSFGFATDPDAVATFNAPGSNFASIDNQVGSQSYPGGFKNVDICVYSAGCTGGGIGNALAPGESDSFTLRLTPTSGQFDNWVKFSQFPIKFQADFGSFQTAGTTTTEIPEPAPIALMGLGLLGLAVWRRRRNKA